MTTTHSSDHMGGFSLIEVTLAILIVALGLLTVFGLLPSSLRMGEDAVNNTRDGLFGETLLAGLRANVANLAPDVWADPDAFRLAACANSIPGIGTIVVFTNSTSAGTNDLNALCKIRFPNDGGPPNLFYRLLIEKENDTPANAVYPYSVDLIVCDNVNAKIIQVNSAFSTKLTYRSRQD